MKAGASHACTRFIDIHESLQGLLWMLANAISLGVVSTHSRADSSAEDEQSSAPRSSRDVDSAFLEQQYVRAVQRHLK